MNGIRVSLFLISLALCHAETLAVVRGRVEGEAVFAANDMTVELQGLDRRDPGLQATVAFDGSFDFRDVVAEQYMLRLGDVSRRYSSRATGRGATLRRPDLDPAAEAG
jgi:hypothetical protein